MLVDTFNTGLMPVYMTLTFAKGHRVAREQETCCYSLAKFKMGPNMFWYAVETSILLTHIIVYCDMSFVQGRHVCIVISVKEGR